MNPIASFSAAAMLAGSIVVPAYAGEPNGGPAGAEAVQQLFGGRATVYNALVNSDGTPVRGHFVSSSVGADGLANAYEVHFAVNVTRCTFTATLGTIDVGGQPPGTATTARRFGVPSAVWVQTWDAAGNPSPQPFHLVVAC